MNFPVRPDDLTPDWLTAELQRTAALGASRVVGFTPAPTAQRGGTADVQVLTLTYDRPSPHAPAKLLAKFSSGNPTIRAAVRDYGIYRREVAFYTRYAAESGISTPRCYSAHYNPADDTCLLLLEFIDDAHARDVSDTAVAEIQLVMTQLATFHAHWWNRAQALPDLESELGATSLARRIAKFDRAYQRLMPDYRHELGEPAATLLDLWHTHARSLADHARRRPATMCHGSLHRGQILFSDHDPQRLCLIDWQSVAVDTAANDLARVLVTGLRPDQRRQSEAELLRRYHQTLATHGVREYSFADLEDDYRLGLVNLLVFHAQVFADYRVDIVTKHWNGQAPVWESLFRIPGEAAADRQVVDWLRRTTAELPP